MKPKILLVISVISTLIFAVAVALNLSPYLRGPAPYFPDWQWQYDFVNTYPKMWLPVVITILLLFIFYKFEKKGKRWIEKNEKKIFSLFVFLGYIFQLSLMYANRAGINGLISRIVSPDVNGYFSTSIQIYSVSDFLKNYNNSVLSFFMHAQGHPPFAILFFYFINKFFLLVPFLSAITVGLSPKSYLIHLIWISLAANEQAGAVFSAFLIPFLVSLTSILVYLVAKRLYGAEISMRSLVAYLFIPSVLLFIPINDAFLSIFPLFSLLLMIKSIDNNSNKLMLLSGFVFSIGVFFSISIAPLIIIFVFLFFSINKKVGLEITKKIIGFLLGFLLIPMVLWIAFNFNSFYMLQILMKGLPEQRHYSTWVLYNLYDFFIFAGIPLFIVFISMFVEQFKNILTKSWKRVDKLFVSFILMLMLVNFSGSVRGEVARIWLPFIPFYIIPLIGLLTRKKFTSLQFVFFLSIQLLIVLTLNEYWVTFW